MAKKPPDKERIIVEKSSDIPLDIPVAGDQDGLIGKSSPDLGLDIPIAGNLGSSESIIATQDPDISTDLPVSSNKETLVGKSSPDLSPSITPAPSMGPSESIITIKNPDISTELPISKDKETLTATKEPDISTNLPVSSNKEMLVEEKFQDLDSNIPIAQNDESDVDRVIVPKVGLSSSIPVAEDDNSKIRETAADLSVNIPAAASVGPSESIVAEPRPDIQSNIPAAGDSNSEIREQSADLSSNIPVAPGIEFVNKSHSFQGEWLPDLDPVEIGAENYRTLRNLRYGPAHPEGVQGYTRINVGDIPLTGYPKIRNGHQLLTDRDTPSYVMVQVENADEDDSKVFLNKTAIGSEGDFVQVELHTDGNAVSDPIHSEENSTDGWAGDDTGGTIAVSSTDPSVGIFHFNIQEATNSIGEGAITDALDTVPHTITVIDLDLKVISGSWTIDVRNSADSTTVATLEPTLTNSSYISKSYEWRSAAAGERIRITIDTAANGQIYIDNVSIRAKELFDDSDNAGLGRFSNAPSGNIAYCNQKESCIWAGDNMRVAALYTVADITVDAADIQFAVGPPGTIIDSDGIDWQALGFLPGQGISITACSEPDNIGSYLIKDVTTAILEIEPIPTATAPNATATIKVTIPKSNPIDFTRAANNELSSSKDVFTIGGGINTDTLLLLHMDGAQSSTTFTDSSSNSHAVTANGSTFIEQSIKKLGTASGLFEPATSDFLSISDDHGVSDYFNMAGNKFTIDFWVRWNSIVPETDYFFIHENDAADGQNGVICYKDANTVYFKIYSAGSVIVSAHASVVAPGGDIPDFPFYPFDSNPPPRSVYFKPGTWHHIAIVRGWGDNDNGWAVTIDGVPGTTVTDASAWPDLSGDLEIGRSRLTIGGALGYLGQTGKTANIDEFRWTTTAVWTAAFSPKASQYISERLKWWTFSTRPLQAINYKLLNPNITASATTLKTWDGSGLTDIPLINDGTITGVGESFEDFRFYAETDPNGKVSIQGKQIILTDGDRNEDYYVTFDLGAGEIGDFFYEVDVNVTAQINSSWSAMYCWAISNANDDLKDIQDASGDEIYIYAGRLSSDTYRFLAYSVDGGTPSEIGISPASIDVGTESFLSINRSSTTVTIEIYSTKALRIAGGSGDIDTISGTAVGTTFQFVYGIASYNNGHLESMSGTITNLSGVHDTSMGKSGSMMFENTSDISKPFHFEGLYLYAYLSELSAGEATIYNTNVNADFQKIVDVWDGVFRQPVSFQTFVFASKTYKDYTLEVNFDADSGTSVGAELDDLATTEHFIVIFEEKMAAFYYSMYATEENTNTAVPIFQRWSGSAWVAETITDETIADVENWETLGKSGIWSFDPPGPGEDVSQKLFGINGYAYKISFDSALSNKVTINRLFGIPAPKTVDAFAFPVMYRNQLMLFGLKEGKQANRADYCLPNAPDVWNGDLSSNDGLQSLFFGGADECLAAEQLFNRYGASIFSLLVVLKKNETYVLTGSDPFNYQVFTISLSLGIAAPLTLTAAEVAFQVTSDVIRNILIWVSHAGPVVFDGTVLVPLKGIESYFDPGHPNYMTAAVIADGNGWYDSVRREYNVIFPVKEVEWNAADGDTAINILDGFGGDRGLKASSTGVNTNAIRANISKSSGKWYWEVTTGGTTAADVGHDIGVMTSGHALGVHVGSEATGWGFSEVSTAGLSRKFNNGDSSAGSPSWINGDIISVAIDLDAGKIWWAINGVWHSSGDPATGANAIFSNLTGTLFPAVSMAPGAGVSSICTTNFGATDFVYDIPDGFSALERTNWFVYDMVKRRWFEKHTGQARFPKAGFPVIDTNGAQLIYGGIDSGQMIQQENGTVWENFLDIPIFQKLETGDFFPTGNIWDLTRIYKFKMAMRKIVEASKNLSITHYTDTGTDGTSLTALDTDSGSTRVIRSTQSSNLLGWSHRFKYEMDTEKTTKGFQPIAWGYQYAIEREDD